MLSLREENFQLLSDEAQDRGITVQELIRAVIIPDWVKQSNPVKTVRLPLAPSDGSGRELVQPIGVRRFGVSHSH